MPRGTPARTKFSAFLSYSWSHDLPLAARLRTLLQTTESPILKRRTVFRDQENLPQRIRPDAEVRQELENALRQSEFFVLLASPTAATSEWVDIEVSVWLEHKGLDRLLVVLTGGEISVNDAGGIDWNTTTALPASLRNAFDSAPLYVDLRSAPEGDLAGAGDTIVAVLDGLSRDEIRGHAEKRRRERDRNRLALYVAIAFVVLIGAIAFYLGG